MEINRLKINLKNWILKNKIEVAILLVVLFVSSFFRFYKVPEYFYFISDAGRDAQAAYKIIFDHKFTLIGPRASVAGFFMGPFYFYLITVPLLIFKMDPIGLAYFASFLGVIAVFSMYLLGKELFNSKIALFIAFLFGVSNLVIIYSRMAWNPSPIPVFTMLMLLSLIKFSKKESNKWFFLTWIFLGLGGQLHYTFLYILPFVLAVFYLKQRNLSKWVKGIVKGVGILLLINSSLIIFDLKHNFITSKAFFDFLFSGKVSLGTSSYITGFWQNYKQLIDLTILQGIYPDPKALLFVLIFIIVLAANRKEKNGLILLLAMFITLTPFSLFKGTVQLYYFNFLLPLPFLVLGYIFNSISTKKYVNILLLVTAGLFFQYNLKSNINLPNPYRTLKEIREISFSITDKVSSQTRFNIASFSSEPWYSAEEYRYYTYYFGKRANEADDYRNIDKLFVITTGVTENPLAIKSQETADFGPKKIEANWVVGSANVFQLSR